MLAFAQALKVSDSKIEDQLCKNSSTYSGTSGCTTTAGSSKGLVALYLNETPSNRPTWPKEKASGGQGINGATAVATNITAMSKDEKAIVAGHLAKTVEGGEVVEIR